MFLLRSQGPSFQAGLHFHLVQALGITLSVCALGGCVNLAHVLMEKAIWNDLVGIPIAWFEDLIQHLSQRHPEEPHKVPSDAAGHRATGASSHHDFVYHQSFEYPYAPSGGASCVSIQEGRRQSRILNQKEAIVNHPMSFRTCPQLVIQQLLICNFRLRDTLI